MKNSWLFLGFVCLFINWIPSLWLVLLFAVIMSLYYVRHYKVHPIFFVVVFILLFQNLNQRVDNMPISKILLIKEVKSNYVIASTGSSKVIVYGLDDVGFDDVIEVKGEYKRISTIHNIGEFSFEKWLSRRNIYFQMNVSSYNIIDEGHSLRHNLYQHIDSIKNKRISEWIKMMLFSIHEDDVTYFITSSGMHISFLAYAMEKIFNKKLSKKNTNLLSFLVIGCIAYITCFSSSLLRILCFRLIAFVFDNYDTHDRLGLSMVLVLLLFPYMAYELAFLLPIGFRLVQVFNIQKRKKLACTFMFLIPMQFQFFHTCNPVQILLFRIFRIGYAYLYLLAWIMILFPFDILYNVSNAFYRIMVYLETFGFSIHYTPNIVWLLLWTFALMKYLSYRQNKMMTFCILLLYTPIAPYLDPFGEITMLDVGQGDCTLVRLPFHQGTMLIDVMGSLYKNVPKDIIVPVLKAKGITHIDKVILTHADYDHSGGFEELKKLIPIDDVIHIKRSDTYLGNLHIPFALSNYKGKDENENSIITYLEVFNLSVLFMGDAGIESEKELLREYPKLKVDVLKLGHHGSKTSSSLEFLHQVNPKIALISAGRNNLYRHPSFEIIERLEAEDILPLTTSVNGSVTIKFCKYFSFFRTADNEFGIIDVR